MNLWSLLKLILRGIVLVALMASQASAQPLRPDGSNQDPASRDETEKRPLSTPGASGQPDKKAGSITLDALRLPARAVLVLYDEAKDALQLLPRLIVMTPEEYQRVQDLIEQLRRQIRTEKPEAPSVCKLRGRVDGSLVRLEAYFEFHTEGQRSLVALGCPESLAPIGKNGWENSLVKANRRGPGLGGRHARQA